MENRHVPEGDQEQKDPTEGVKDLVAFSKEMVESFQGSVSIEGTSQQLNVNQRDTTTKIENRKAVVNEAIHAQGNVMLNPNIDQSKNVHISIVHQHFNVQNAPEVPSTSMGVEKSPVGGLVEDKEDENDNNPEDIIQADIMDEIDDDIMDSNVNRGDWSSFLQSDDASNIPEKDIKKLAKLLLKVGEVKERKFEKTKIDCSMEDKKAVEKIFEQFIKREPARNSMKIFITALENSNFQNAHRMITTARNKKIISKDNHSTLKQVLKAYKENLLESSDTAITCQIRPLMSIDDDCLPEPERNLDVLKLHVGRRFRDINTGEIHENIESIFENGNRVILVQGGSGIGKSSSYKNMLLQWAKEEILKKYKIALAMTCRSLIANKTCLLEDLIFYLSPINTSEVDEQKQLSLRQIEKLAEDGKALVSLDGADEVEIPRSKQQIQKILAKIHKARKNQAVELTPADIVIGLLTNQLIANARLFIAGREEAISQLNEFIYKEVVPETCIPLKDGTQITLRKETIQSSKNVEILEFTEDNLKEMSHNLLCQENLDCKQEEMSQCRQAFNALMEVAPTMPLIFVPSIAKWGLEIANSNIQRGEKNGFSASNLTGIMLEMLLGKAREHSSIDPALVQDFNSLKSQEETKHLAECIEKLTQISHQALLHNEIEIKGQKKDKMIKVKDITVSLEDTRKLGLMKITETRTSKIFLEAQHLSVQEFLASTFLRVGPVENMEVSLEKMEPGRKLAVMRYIAGLCANQNELVEDYVEMFNGHPPESSEVLRELRRLAVCWKQENLPDMRDYSTMKINGCRVSGRSLGLLNVITKESGKQIPFAVMEELMEQLNARNDALDDKAKFNLEISQIDPEESPDPEDQQFICHIKPEGDHEDKRWFEMGSSDWSSLCFHDINVEGEYKYTHQIKRVKCSGRIPKQVDTALVAGVLVEAEFVKFEGFTLTTDLVLSLRTSLSTSHNSKLKKAVIWSTDVAADPDSLGDFLACMEYVNMYRVRNMTSQHWEGWRTAALRRVQLNTQVLEEVLLQGVDVGHVEDDIIASFLSTIPKVMLNHIKMSSGAWKSWGPQLARVREEGKGGLRNLRLFQMDVGEVEEEDLGEVAAAVPTFTLEDVSNMGEGHWSAIQANVVQRKEKQAVVMDTLELKGIEVSHVDPDIMGSLLANLGEVSLPKNIFGDASRGHWESFSRHVEENHQKKKAVIRKLNVEAMSDEELKENKSLVDAIKAHLAPNEEK